MSIAARRDAARVLAGGDMSIRGVEEQLREIEEQLAQAQASGDGMAQTFKALFPDAPGYLIRVRDRGGLVEYRWRRSSAQRWRGEGAKVGVNMGMSLLSGDGLLLLDWLPPETRIVWLDYEQRRIDINHEMAQLTYARRRMRDWLERSRKIADLRRAARGEIARDGNN